LALAFEHNYTFGQDLQYLPFFWYFLQHFFFFLAKVIPSPRQAKYSSKVGWQPEQLSGQPSSSCWAGDCLNLIMVFSGVQLSGTEGQKQ
jgi:hypothetical protein